MNLSALCSSISVVYPLKISLSSDKFYVLKTSSIEDRGHLFSETIGISRIFCCFHPLQIDKINSDFSERIFTIGGQEKCFLVSI